MYSTQRLALWLVSFLGIVCGGCSNTVSVPMTLTLAPGDRQAIELDARHAEEMHLDNHGPGTLNLAIANDRPGSMVRVTVGPRSHYKADVEGAQAIVLENNGTEYLTVEYSVAVDEPDDDDSPDDEPTPPMP